MNHSVKKSRKRARRLINQLAVEKKKAVTALCLIGVMGFMWIRVLIRITPEAAGAGIGVEPSNVREPTNPELHIAFMELPKVAGRNDVITRDFFASEKWRHFIEKQKKHSGMEEVNVLSQYVDEEVIRRLAKKLKLEAIIVSENPLAYINGEPIKVGDKMSIGDGNNKYECDVVVIEENTVVLKCKEAKIILKLEQELGTDN
jgi:hypothetical protein